MLFFLYASNSGYLERDPSVVEFIERTKDKESVQSKSKLNKIKKIEEKGKKSKNTFGLDQDDIENIFDMLEKEHPDL